MSERNFKKFRKMPELPEVHTTVEGLKKTITGKIIKEVWSDFHIGTSRGKSQTIKNKKYFDKFRKIIIGSKIKNVERKGKNILINLNPSTGSGQAAYTIIVHMKMTGHLMIGKYEFKKIWTPLEKGPLQDPYNKYIHLVLSLSDGRHLALSDMRKFASVTISKTERLRLHDTIGKLGMDPFDPKLSAEKFFEIILRRKNWPIKSALLDQNIVSGIGNIYSDEILWQTGIHPLSKTGKIPEKKLEEILRTTKKILKFSIKHGGDSKSDYRNIFGEKGGFQKFHKAYGRKNLKCPKSGCLGIIKRIVVKGRSSHFCPKHQKKYG